MSERLKQMVEDSIIRLGKKGRQKLALRADLSLSTLVDIVKHGHVPLPANVYKLALACGLAEEEALALAREASEPGRKAV